MHPSLIGGLEDELLKIALATATPEQAAAEKDGFQRAMMVGGGAVGAHMVSKPFQRMASNSLVKGERGAKTTPEQVEKLRKAIHPEGYAHTVEHGGVSKAFHIPKGTDVSGVKGQMFSHAYGIPKDVMKNVGKKGFSHIPLDTGAHVAAHELGHGAFREGRIGSAVSALRGRKFNMPLSIASTLGSYGMAVRDPDSMASKLAPVVGGLQHLPTLVDEGVASTKAVRHMGKLQMPTGTAKKQLLKAFGTYAASAAPAVVGPALVRQMMKARKKAKEVSK